LPAAEAPVRILATAGGDPSWWRGIFEASEDILLVCQPDGRIAEANRRARRFFGADALATSASIFPALTPATAQRLKVFFQRGSAPAETFTSIGFTPGGSTRMIVDLALSRLDAGHWLLTLKDATRRWRIESHVQRLITALDATPDVFFLTDSEYKITFVNAAFQTVTGHNIEETLGRTADFLRATEDHGKIAEYLESVEAGGDWVGEITNVRRDGTRYPVEATISPIYDRSGTLLGYVCSERDITAKRAMQAEIVAQRDFSESVLHSINAAVYAMDREFRLVQANGIWRNYPAEHGLLKLEGPPKTGVSLLDLVPNPAKRLEMKLAFESVLRTGEQAEFCSSTAGRHWVSKISPWKQGTEVAGLICKVSDNTKLHELQSALYQAQKLETIGSLAAGIAHDFNNLLLVIRGNTTILLLGEDYPEAGRKFLQNIEQASARASDITQQLLAFSRASQDKLAVFDFNAIIAEIAQLSGRSLKSNIEMRVLPAPGPCKVNMGPSRAHQIVLNLCVNAQDAMPLGGLLQLRNELVKLIPQQAAKTQFPAGTPFLRCTVSDTGTGIPPEVLPRIFDPFFTTKDPGRGTGLGLSIVHGIVGQAGGFVEVESVLGHGTSFHVFLPTVDSEITVSVDQGTKISPCSGKLLVVDDIELVLECTCDFLKAVGFQTFSARNSDEALELLEREAIDLLLTDFNMPGMSGLELIAEVKKRWPKIQCVLASGYLEDHIEQRLRDEFKAGTLRKPYNVADAAELVRKMLAPGTPAPA